MIRGAGAKARERRVAPGVRSEEIIKATVWRLHLAGKPPESIAAEVNAKWGDGDALMDCQAVTAWIARQSARRGSTPRTRLSRLSKLEAGLELLRGELAIGYANLETEEHPNGRAGAFIALGAVCDFVEGFADITEGKLSVPIRALMMALRDLDDGVANPMLDRANVGHRTPGSDAWHTMVSFAVVAMEAAIATGLGLDQAAARIAEDLHRRGYRQSNGKAIKGATVRNWRARAAEGLGGSYDHAARRLALVRSLVADSGRVHSDGWKRVLDALDRWAPITGIRKMTGS